METPKVKVESDINRVKGKNRQPWEYWHCYFSTYSTYTAGKTWWRATYWYRWRKWL